MFHRPKTEEQDPQNKANEAPAAAASEQPEVVKHVQAAEQAAAPKQEIQTPVKEEKVMSNDKPESRETEERSVDAPAAGTPFQRPPQMQRSVPGGFAGPYGGQTMSSEARATGEERRLVIGQGITMSGEIEACDYLLVEGTLEAALKGAKILDIAETGTFYGSVEIESATIGGRFEGELTVNGRLTIKAGGSVTGSVAYKELAIEAGAVLDGKVSPLAGVAASSAEPRKPMAAKNDNAGKEELPFSGNAASAAE